jgi:hypothetical protein
MIRGVALSSVGGQIERGEMVRTFVLCAAVVVTALLPFQASAAGGRAGGAHLSSARDEAAALQSESVGGPFTSLCTAATMFGSNVQANCDSTVLPHNETAIAADPANAAHLVAGSNDTELPPSGASGSAKGVAGYYTSFDGGATWLNGQVPSGSFTQTSDPSVVFDSSGRVHYGVVAFDLGLGGLALGGAIQVATSSDGGRTFGAPTVVDRSTDPRIFEDKPYVAADDNSTSPFDGSVYVTWTRFHFDDRAATQYLESPIFFSASRDGGRTWSAPREISGMNSTLCTFSSTPLPNDGRCREDQFSSPLVASDGTIFVAYQNDQAVNDGQLRNQYLVAKSSDGGATWSTPVRASDVLHDGSSDYPLNVQGRQTLSNSQFRVNSAGNLAIDPASGALYVTWSDNRNGTAASTNTDIFAARSVDGGATWSSPITVSSASNDQFYPWAEVAPDGTVEISYFDRSYDSANSKYGITLAKLQPGTSQRVDTGLSDPNHARWFSGSTNGETTFLGDYNGLVVGTDAVAHPFWTDMRRVITANRATGTTEDVFTAAIH